MSQPTDTPPALEARRNEALPAQARVLEIGSGTGEHAATLLGLREDVSWQPSDPDAASRLSQDAWGSDFGGRM